MQIGAIITSENPVAVRPASPGDTGLIFAFVKELAAFEQLSSEVEIDEAGLAAALFVDKPRVFCEIAEYDGAPAGFTGKPI